MKTLCFSIIAGSVMVLLLPLNVILAQSEIQPKIEFENASYFIKKMHCNDIPVLCPSSPGEWTKATIIVTDPMANKFGASIDRITVYVWSDSDRKGIVITAYETQVNSGIFRGTVLISDDQSTQDKIHVS